MPEKQLRGAQLLVDCKAMNRFSDPVKISRSIIKHLASSHQIRTGSDLQRLADDLVTSELEFEAMKKSFDDQDLISRIVSRMPRHHAHKWRKQALDGKEMNGDYPGFKEFVKFVRRAASDDNDPVYGFKGLCSEQSSKGKGISHVVAGNVVRPGKSRINHSCPKCNKDHRLYTCDSFKSLDVESRNKFVKSKNLCFNCFLSNHVVSDCKSPTRCKYCNKRHNSLLHVFTVSGQSDNSHVKTPARSLDLNVGSDSVATGVANVSTTGSHVNEICHKKSGRVMLPVVPVIVNDEIRTHALLDSASTHSFVKTTLVDRLRLKGTRSKLNLSTLNDSTEKITHFHNLKVTGVDNGCLEIRRAYEIDDIPVPNVECPNKHYTHLKDMPEVDPSDVTLLIGQDCSEGLIPLEVRTGAPGEPYGIRTLLGWCVSGVMSQGMSFSINADVVNMLISGKQRDIDALWDIEQEASAIEEKALSLNDKKVLQLWEDNLRVVDGKYELPIPWKLGHPQLPNNYTMASKRLSSLNTKLCREGLFEEYDSQVKALIAKGYAEYVPHNEINTEDGSVWYLPHHHVYKKNDKLRIVHDCAVELGGLSLNKSCHQGPDLNNLLLGVLLRFRLRRYA